LGGDNPEGERLKSLPQHLPEGFFGWIRPVWQYKERDVIELCGLDVAVYFRLLNLGESRRLAVAA
jgi:hypothetical protein